MAHVYVYSGAAGAGTGADWANAYTTLEAAAEAAGTAAGDSIWVAHDHAESQAAAVTITFKNTSAAPGTVMCVNRAGTVPPVSADLRTTAVVTTTGGNVLSLLSGVTYIYGVTFSSGSGAINPILNIGYQASYMYLKNCALKIPATLAGAIVFGGGGASSRVVLDNTSIEVGHVSDHVQMGTGNLLWKNTGTPVTGATLPTTLFGASSNDSIVVVSGVDFSVLSSGTLVGSTFIGLALFRNCKVHASAILATVPSTSSRTGANFINCDSGDTNYRTEKYAYEGTLTTETTVVHSGGAGDGTTPISWKIVTNADAELLFPFESLPIAIWNETTGARTVTVQGIWNSGSLPDNDEIWMEVEYLGTSSSTKSSFASTGLADLLAPPAALTAGDGTWGGSTTKFKMVAPITVAEKGPIHVKVFVAAQLATIYIDPKVVLS